MQVWNVLHAAHGKYRTQKIAKNSLSAHHRTTLSGCIFASKACIDNRKNVNQQYLLQLYLHNMANFGRLTADIGLPVWGTPVHFNGFRVLPSLLQRRRSPEANQTLHDAWPSPGLVLTIYTFLAALAPLRHFIRSNIYFPSKLTDRMVQITFSYRKPCAKVEICGKTGTVCRLPPFWTEEVNDVGRL